MRNSMVHLVKFSHLGKKPYEQKYKGGVFGTKFNIFWVAFKCCSTITYDNSFE